MNTVLPFCFVYVLTLFLNDLIKILSCREISITVIIVLKELVHSDFMWRVPAILSCYFFLIDMRNKSMCLLILWLLLKPLSMKSFCDHRESCIELYICIGSPTH